jgi:hypothetical protein
MDLRRATLSLILPLIWLSSACGEEPLNYNKARWDPIHRQPGILTATNQDCLKCHNEILSHKPRKQSPAGLKASEVLAWYQTLDTYEGDQQSFHWRHLESPYAKKVMELKCNFCHQGNDPREEAPSPPTGPQKGFTLRKVVDTQQVCLKCHGTFNWQVMTLPAPMPGPWFEYRDRYQNDCLSCHAVYRTVRHQVSYLKADAIETLAKPQNLGGDVCYGCHGGRAWYRNSYPFPRHPYPGMDKIPVPEPAWAKDRPKVSDPRYALPLNMLIPQGDKQESTGETQAAIPQETKPAKSGTEQPQGAKPAEKANPVSEQAQAAGTDNE